MRRRAILAVLGTSVSLAGCQEKRTTSDGATETPSPPDDCPDPQGFDASLPDDITEDAVRSFVRDYEQAYIYDRYITEEMSVGAEPEPTVQDLDASNHGFVVHVQTVWSTTILEGTLIVAEPKEEVPDEIDPINVESLPESAEPVANVAHEAATENEEARWKDSRQDHESIASGLGPAQVDNGYYVTVEGDPILVRILSTSEIITDGEEVAWYFVNEVAVRRTDDRDRDPSDGDLMECFSAN